MASVDENGSSVVPKEIHRLEDTAQQAQELLAEASEEGVPIQEMVSALLLNALSLIVNFCIPAGTYELFSDSGLIDANCQEGNAQWSLYKALSRTAGFVSLFFMALACVLGILVNGIWPCRRSKPMAAKRRRRLLLAWLLTMLLSMATLFLFQLSQDPGYVLSQLQGGDADDCSEAQVYKEDNGFNRLPLFLAGMAVSQYGSGLVVVSRHLWSDRKDFDELKTAVQELGHDLVEAKHEVSNAALEAGHGVKATVLGLARPDKEHGSSNEDSKEPDSEPFGDPREIDDACPAPCSTLCGQA